MRIPGLACAALSILAMSGTAADASTVSATLSNLHVELFDLNKGDGIDPYIVFHSSQGGTFVASETGVMNADGGFTRNTDIRSGGATFGSGLAASAMGSASAFAALGGNPFEEGANASAFATSISPGFYGSSTVMLGDGADYVSFTLSPETEIVISGDAAVSVSSTVDDPSAQAWASVFLKLTDQTGSDRASYGGAFAQQGSTDGSRPYTSSDNEHLQIFFENSEADEAEGIFFGSVEASASDITPAISVSEPSVMWLLGFGAAPFMLRRLRLRRLAAASRR